MPSSTAETILVLSPDQTAVALREIQKTFGALDTIAEALRKNIPLDAGLAHNILYLSEHYLVDLGKALNIQTDGASVISKRCADLRDANIRIRELERQLGNGQSPRMTQMKLKNLADHLSKWWKSDGFGHISDINFGGHGCAVKFSCGLYGHFRLTDSDTPLSDKEQKILWHQKLEEQGYVLGNDRGDLSIVDCEASRKTLCDLMALRLPSAKVTEFENHGNNDGLFVLRTVKVYIRDISEIEALPVLGKHDAE